MGFLKYYDHAEIKGRRAGRKTRRKGGTRTNGVFETQMCLDEPQVRFFPLHLIFFLVFYWLLFTYRLRTTTGLPRRLPPLPLPLQPLPSTTRTIGTRDASRAPGIFFLSFFFTQLITISTGFFFSLIKTNIGREGNSRGDEKDINGARDASWRVPSPLVFFFYFRSLFTEYLTYCIYFIIKTCANTPKTVIWKCQWESKVTGDSVKQYNHLH